MPGSTWLRAQCALSGYRTKMGMDVESELGEAVDGLGALGAAVEQVTDYHVQREWREAEDGRQGDSLGPLLSREVMP